MRFLSALHDVPYPVKQNDCKDRQRKPYAGERQAHLPKDIERDVLVVPNPQAEPEVQDAPGDKLGCCDCYSTDGRLQKQWAVPWQFTPESSKRDAQDHRQCQHRPTD